MEHIIGQGGGAAMGMPALGTLPVIKCPTCGSICFENVFLLRVLSALQSPNGQENIIPEPTFRCTRCGYIHGGISDENKDSQPEEKPNEEEPDKNDDGPKEGKLKLV